jgi:protein-tyrosine phosphatase
MIPEPGANIAIESVPNLRDLGGWPTPGGTVRRGLLFRSAQFSDVTGPDADLFARLSVRSVFDMRTAEERAQQPNIVPESVRYVVVDILRDATGAAPAQLLALLHDPAAAESMLGGGKAIVLFKGAYRQLISLPSALSGYRAFFSDLLDPLSVPAVFHCTTGKDRTGWGAAALLLLLGVSYDDVLDDYLLTNVQLLSSTQPLFDAFAAAGGNPELLRPVLGVQKEYLEVAIDEMTSRFGSIESYFRDGLEIGDDDIVRLREVFTEPA